MRDGESEVLESYNGGGAREVVPAPGLNEQLTRFNGIDGVTAALLLAINAASWSAEREWLGQPLARVGVLCIAALCVFVGLVTLLRIRFNRLSFRLRIQGEQQLRK